MVHGGAITMSVESRLAAKERSRKARRKASAKKWTAILFLPVLALIIVAIVLIYKYVTAIDYSRHIAKDGTVKGVTAKDCFSAFPDLNAIDIKVAEITDEELEEAVISKMKDLDSSLSTTTTDGSDTTADGETKTDGETTEAEKKPELTQEWVKAHAESYLADYELTTDGFRNAVRDDLKKTKRSEAENKIADYLGENAKIKKYPGGFTRNRRKILREQDKQYFALYQGFGLIEADMTFDEYIVNSYGGETEYNDDLKTRAKSNVKNLLTWLTVFDELGLSVSEEAVVDWNAHESGKEDATDEEKKELWNQSVEEYGAPYLYMNYRVETAQEELFKKVLGE